MIENIIDIKEQNKNLKNGDAWYNPNTKELHRWSAKEHKWIKQEVKK